MTDKVRIRGKIFPQHWNDVFMRDNLMVNALIYRCLKIAYYFRSVCQSDRYFMSEGIRGQIAGSILQPENNLPGIVKCWFPLKIYIFRMTGDLTRPVVEQRSRSIR